MNEIRFCPDQLAGKRVNCITVAAIFIALTATYARGEDSPTKSQTANFISKKTGVYYSNSWFKSQEQSVWFTDDYCTINEKTVHHPTDGSAFRTEKTIALSELDPTRIEYRSDCERCNVTLNTYEDRSVVLKRTNEPGMPESQYSNIFTFGVLAPEGPNPQKVAKALGHLITLCGGKKELF